MRCAIVAKLVGARRFCSRYFRLAQYCPGPDFDEEYIKDTLVENFEDTDPIINDEWKDYWSRILKRIIADVRQLQNIQNIQECCYAQHPLSEYLRWKNIFSNQKKKKSYSPLLQISDPKYPNGKFPLTVFDTESWHQKLVDEILKYKV